MVNPIHQVFSELPDLECPPPVWKSRSDTIALIPVFSTTHFPNDTLAYLRAAIYSRATCLRNTDANPVGVPVKLFIEAELRNAAAPILEDNYIDIYTDVIFFETRLIEGTVNNDYNFLGKKMTHYYDSQVATYEKVISWDADTFFLDVPDLFSKLLQTPYEKIGYFGTYVYDPFLNWQHTWEMKIRRGGMPAEKILDMIGFTTDPKTLYPIGMMNVYPSRYFHTHFADFILWIHDYSPYIGSDETTLWIASEKFGFDIYSIATELGLTYGKIRGDFDNTAPIINGDPPPESSETFTHLLRTATTQMYRY